MRTGDKIKASLNLHENLLAKKFDNRECKYYMIKRFRNSNFKFKSKFQKIFFQHAASVRSP